MKTLIKNGRIVTAVDDYRADILIEDETISVTVVLDKGFAII
jgi:dihydroorotase-like cyclic amidohydrolase